MPTSTMDIQHLLLDTVSCGDEDLRSFILNNMAVIWCLSGGSSCTDTLKYLNVQLELISLAQGYAAKRIDEAKTSYNAVGDEKSWSKSQRDGSSQNTAAGTSCSWQRARSSQQFWRDTQEDAQGFSSSFDTMYGTSNDDGRDRSHQERAGWSTSYDFAYSLGLGKRFSQETSSTSFYNTFTESTAPMAATLPTIPPITVINLPVAFNTPEVSIDTPFGPFVIPAIPVVGSVPYPVLPLDPLSNFEGPSGVACSADPNAPIALVPSVGASAGWSGCVSASASVFGIGVSVEACYRADDRFRHDHVASRGNNQSTLEAQSSSNQFSSNVSTSFHTSASADDGANTHDVARSGDTRRNSYGQTRSASSSAGAGHGETHNHSERYGHGQSGNAAHATSSSRGELVGEGSRSYNSIGHQEAYRWGQIADALRDLWRSTMDDIKVAQRIITSSGVGAAGCITAGPLIPCGTSGNVIIKRQSDPCLFACAGSVLR